MTEREKSAALPAVTGLRTDHLVEPIGIDSPQPWMSWELPAAYDGQSAIELCTATSSEALQAGEGEHYRLPQGPCNGLVWPGPPLTSRQRVYWQMRVCDGVGRWGDWSSIQYFEMGLLEDQDWTADWVEARGHGAALFRCPFTLERPLAELQRARFYGAAAGLLVPRLNGAAIGDQVLAPEYTDATLRVPYLTLPVEELLQTGENCLALALGGGWFENQGYGRRRLRVRLELDWLGGERQVIGDKASAWWCTAGPWRREDIYDGECYDARLAIPGWDQPGSPQGDWLVCGRGFAVDGTDGPGGVMVGRRSAPIRVVEEHAPQRSWRPRPDRLLLDFGVQQVGWLSILGSAMAGTVVELQFAELLNDTGEDVATRTLWGAASRDRYIFAGTGEERWRPCFTYHGFRYVRVTAPPAVLDHLVCRAEYVRSDCASTGRLRCADAGLEQLFAMTTRSIGSTMQGVWIDCPARDERQGYLGDTVTGIEALVDTHDAIGFLRKWGADLLGVQDPQSGFRWARMAPPCARHMKLPTRARTHAAIASRRPATHQADSVYTAALTILPWTCYRETGDVRILAEHGPSILQHLRALRSRADWPLLTSSRGDYSQYHDIRGVTPGSDHRLIAAAVQLWELRIATRLASILDWSTAIAEELAAAIEGTVEALQSTFLSDGHFGSQAGNALALLLQFGPPEGDAVLLQALVEDLQANDGHLTTGIVGTRFVLEALSRHGRCDLALRAVTAAGEPGWSWMLADGATALAEHLVTRWPNTVRNHRIFGMLGEWLMRHVGGIRQTDDSVGFEQVLIAPGLLGHLNQISAQRHSARGPISLDWHAPSGRLKISLPGGCHGELHLPPGWQASSRTLRPGEQTLVLRAGP